MASPRVTARVWHLLTAVVTIAALVLQFVLVLDGHRTLLAAGPPSTKGSVVRFFSYFTILSNILVAWSTTTLATGADRDTRIWRVLRLNAVVGIAVTALVHWFLLRPLLDLHGADYLADKLLHIVVPAVAVAGWLAFGPRRRIRTGDLLPTAVYPAGYLVWTLAHGAATGWYPYPFIDVAEHGYPVVLVNAAGVVMLLVSLSVAAWWADQRLTGATVDPPSADAGSGVTR